MPKEKVKSLGSSTVPWCGYADNLVLFMLDINSLERATTIFDEVFTNCGLCLNIPWYYNKCPQYTASELYWVQIT